MALGTEEVCLCMNIALGYFRGLRVSTAMLHTMFKVSYHDLVESLKAIVIMPKALLHIYSGPYIQRTQNTHTHKHTLSLTRGTRNIHSSVRHARKNP